MEREGTEKMYFLLETKGSTQLSDLRTKEQLKIYCEKKHFEAVGEVEIEVVRDWTEFKKQR